jgi:hypothetical protein
VVLNSGFSTSATTTAFFTVVLRGTSTIVPGDAIWKDAYVKLGALEYRRRT